MAEIVLIFILFLVFVLPLAVSDIEKNLEIFLFFMGLTAVFLSGKMQGELILKAVKEPFVISLVVLLAGVIFEKFKINIRNHIYRLLNVISLRIFIFISVLSLGLVSSFITAIIAALILIEILEALPLKRNCAVSIAVVACFAIGLGAALTPVGEPLGAIAVSRLNKDFSYLFSLLGGYIVPGILVLAVLAALLVNNKAVYIKTIEEKRKNKTAKYFSVLIRAVKVYIFVMALCFLGEGFEPIINIIFQLNINTLYWINIVSAVLDNATLAAAELSPQMSGLQIRSILLALLISGGMLIPGNIPNIIAAHKLNITSKEWAGVGVPLGIVLLIVYYIIIF